MPRTPMSADPTAPSEAVEVVRFWLDAGPERWFARDEAFDQVVRERLGALRSRAKDGDLDSWRQTPEGALALLILLDQAPRNMFRGSAESYATDAAARAVADQAIARGFDIGFPVGVRRFFYLPFMHSEALADQERCIELCAAAGDEEGLHYARIHADVIRRFGRFPHRNPALGRETTPDERDFLDEGGFSG